jgi:outer membrane immunogenic protein
MFSGAVMKKLATAIAVIALIGTPAFAADIPVKAPPSPPPAPVYSWTGFYAGMNAGWSWGKQDTTVNFVQTSGSRGRMSAFGGKADIEI